MEIYAVNLAKGVPSNYFVKLLNLMQPELKKKIGRYRFIQDAERSLIGYRMIYYLLYKEFGSYSTDMKLAFSQYGKPYFPDFSSFHFNLSHSGDWVVCAVDQKSIGIDIEQINEIDLTIADRYFSSEESKQMHQLKEEQKKERFYDLWTLKEAYIKAIGCGMTLPLNTFGFSFESITGQGFCIKLTHQNQNSPYYFTQYDIDSNYRLSVCAQSESFPREVKILNVQALIEELHEPPYF